MSTAAAPRGKTIEFLTKKESSFGTSPSGNWFKTFCYADPAGDFRQPREPDPLLGVPRNNNRDKTASGPGLVTLEGAISVPLDLNHLYFWLERLFGAPTSTGSDPDYTHVFASGGEVLPHWASETKLASSVFLRNLGQLATKWSLDISRKAGYERCTVEFSGKTQGKFTTSAGGTPSAALDRAPLAASLAVFKIDGVLAADVMSVKCEYDNGVTPQDFMSGTPYISGHDLDNEASFKVSDLQLRFRNATLYDQAVAGTPFAGEILWQISAARSLSIAFPIARLEPTSPKIGGPGAIMQNFSAEAEQDASNPALTVTLKSGTPAASYG